MSFSFLENRLNQARSRSQYRKLSKNCSIDFHSNDYLGFATDPDFQELLRKSILAYSGNVSGSTGSRLISGNYELLEKVEKKLADFSKSQDSVFFPTGYQANTALFSSLIHKDDIVISDELNHASIIDGIKLSKGKVKVFKHNDLTSLEEKLIESSNCSGQIFVVCEGLYSMEGHFAHLCKIVDLSKKYNAHLIVDESHTTGVYGSGLVNHLGLRECVFCTIHTAGKSFGCSGAWVACNQKLKDYLVNFSRGLIFSTAPSPLQLISVEAALFYYKSVGEKRSQKLLEMANKLRSYFSSSLENSTIQVIGNASPIIPIILGSNKAVLKSKDLFEKYDISVGAIRYPTVPRGQERIRICIHSSNTQIEIERLVSVFNLITKDENHEINFHYGH